MGKNSNRGFSLAELSIGVAVVGVLSVAAVPSVRSYLESRSASDASNQIELHIRMARSRAVMEGNTYFIQFVDNNTYLVVDDDGGGAGIPGAAGYVALNRGNLIADVGETVRGPFDLPQGMLFAAGSGSRNPFTGNGFNGAVSFPQVNGFATLIFNANGTANSTGYVTLAHERSIADGSLQKSKALRVLRSTGNVTVMPLSYATPSGGGGM